MNDRNEVMIIASGKGVRWWPNPASRPAGSPWIVPAVAQWHPAASAEAAWVAFRAREGLGV